MFKIDNSNIMTNATSEHINCFFPITPQIISLELEKVYWRNVNLSIWKAGGVDKKFLREEDKEEYTKFNKLFPDVFTSTDQNLIFKLDISKILINDVNFLKYIPFWFHPEIIKQATPTARNFIIQKLCCSSEKYFSIWWDETFIDWQQHSSVLIRYQSNNIREWWNPYKFHYKSSYYFLPFYDYPFYFLWSEDIIKSCLDYDKNDSLKTRMISSFIRGLVTSYPEHFDVWWPIVKDYLDQYFYREYGGELARCLPDKFDYWWNKDLYPYHVCFQVAFLVKHCNEYFDKWFKQEIFESEEWWKQYPNLLYLHCSSNFKKWFKPRIFKMRYTGTTSNTIEYLTEYCSDHFELWWPICKLKTYYSDRFFKLLEIHCSKYQNIWGTEYIMYKLRKEQGL